MPRRPAAPPEDRFLRADLNDPDNQAALLRAYLELKQATTDLSQKLVQAGAELSRREAAGDEVARQAKEAGREELAQKSARLERMGEAMRLVKWAAEWAEKGASFLVGTRADLGQVVTVATSGAETCDRLRYDKATDTWTLAWGDGRPETVLLVSAAQTKGGEPPLTARRRRTFPGH